MLGDETDERHEADLGVDVQACALHAEEDEDHGAEDRHRHRHHHDQRIAEAFELCREHEEDDDDREREREQERARFLHVLPRLAAVVDAVAGRQLLLRELLQIGQRLAERAGRHGGERGRVELLEVADARRDGLRLQAHDRRGRHHAAVRGADVVVVELVRIQAVRLLHLRNHLVRAAGDAEVVHVTAAEHGAERGADVLHREPERGDLVAVDLHGDLRLVELQIAVDVVELAAVLRRLEDVARDFIEIRERLGGADHEGHRRVGAAAAGRQRGRLRGVDRRTGDLVDLGLHVVLQLGRVALALAPGLEDDAGQRRVRTLDAGELEDLVVLGHAGDDVIDLLRVQLHLVDGRIRRRVAVGDHETLVFLRRQLVLDAERLRRDQHQRDQADDDEAEAHDRLPVAQHRAEHALVDAARALEIAIDRLHELAFAMLGAQELRGHHRRQRQRHDGRHGDRTGERERELREQGTGQAALEADRHIDRDQHDRDRDDRPGQLARTEQRGIERLHAVLEVAVDVLDDDDRVVDNKSDREHQREQRQQVHGIAEHQHDEEAADQRQRDRDRRDQHRARRAEEQEDHDGDDDQRLDQRLDHFIDRIVDVAGRVIGDLAGQAGRKLVDDLREDIAHALDHGQQVRIRCDLDADEHRLLAVERHLGVVVLGAERDVGHILQTHDGAVLLLEHELLELVDRVQIGAGREVDRDHLALGVADGRDVVVRVQRRVDIARGQAGRGELLRIEPGAQREGARAEDLRGLHAGHGLQLRLHDADQVVRDLVRRQRLAVEAEIHRVGAFAGRHGQLRLLGLRRQLVDDRLHLGVDLGQRAAAVVVQAQARRDRADAGAAGRAQVVDALRLRDRGLERRGDEAGDDVGIRTVVGRGHGDRGDLGLRILAHRQRAERAQAEHEDQDADDHRQHRLADEDIGKGHGVWPVRARWAAIILRPASGSDRWSAARCC